MTPFLALLSAAALAGPANVPTERLVTRLADGVYAIQHRDAEDGFAGGNTMVMIGARQVLVVDAPFLPSEAREDIAQIRQWTNKPVAFLLNTHFHNDHNLGNRAYMDAFPAITIIAHAETRAEMDRFGPSSRDREERSTTRLQQMLDRGTAGNGAVLSDSDKAQVRQMLSRRREVLAELDGYRFQGATLSFEHDLSIDLGDREVQVKFLGRGNTGGDAVAFLPRERIVAAGDLVVYPMPYFYDGYPSEWPGTLEHLEALMPTVIVPGHGPILRDTVYVSLVRDFIRSAVEQLNQALRATGPAMFRTVAEVRPRIDLSSFRQRFAGDDADAGAAFDRTTSDLVNLAFREASLR